MDYDVWPDPPASFLKEVAWEQFRKNIEQLGLVVSQTQWHMLAKAFGGLSSKPDEWGYAPRGRRNGKLSDHASGLAMDHMHFEYTDSRDVEVAQTTPPPPKIPKHVGPRPARQFDHRGRRRF